MSDVSNPPRTTPIDAPTGVARDAVLLIEDNETIATLLVSLLRSMKLRVLESSDGAQATSLFEQHKDEILLVLADCRLPDADGRELCMKFREAVPELPVLVTSGSVSGRGIAPLPKGKFVEYLPKPYSPAEVLHKVRRLIDAAGGARSAAVRG